jgi:hypothetical protein
MLNDQQNNSGDGTRLFCDHGQIAPGTGRLALDDGLIGGASQQHQNHAHEDKGETF